MSNDLPNSEVFEQFHNDLLVERLTDSDSTGFRNDLEKERAWTGAENHLVGGFFYRLVRVKGGRLF